MPALPAGIFDAVADLARSAWAYLMIPPFILVDAIVGVLPSETILHAAGVGAAQDDLSVVLVIAEATAAAVAADFLLFTIGAKGSGRIRGFVIRGERSQRRYDSVSGQLEERRWLLTVARFVPGLRTVTMLAAGTTGMARSQFFAYEVPGAALWASYNVVLGYVLGLVFRDSGFWVPLAISAAIAAALAVTFELVRRARLAVS